MDPNPGTEARVNGEACGRQARGRKMVGGRTHSSATWPPASAADAAEGRRHPPREPDFTLVLLGMGRTFPFSPQPTLQYLVTATLKN